MTVQGIAAQGVFMEKVPNTFLRATPFSLVCLASNSFPRKLRAVIPIVLCVCIGLRIPQNWEAFFCTLPPQGKERDAKKNKMRRKTRNRNVENYFKW